MTLREMWQQLRTLGGTALGDPEASIEPQERAELARAVIDAAGRASSGLVIELLELRAIVDELIEWNDRTRLRFGSAWTHLDPIVARAKEARKPKP